MDIKECYEILGITKKATDEQVKKAYREIQTISSWLHRMTRCNC